MADTKITALTAIGANPIIPSTFPIPMVDLTDTSMAASGTTKKVTVNQILQAGGTATLASATITGDLTVDTSTLKVDSANDAVGIGTATPASYSGSKLTVYTAANTLLTIGQVNSYANLQSNGYDFYINTNVGGAASNGGSFVIRHGSSSAVQYNIASGVHTWQNVGGVAGTAMTLNSTGLGVGASPSTRLHIQNTGDVYARIATTSVSKAGVQFSANGVVRSHLLYDDGAGTTYLTTGTSFGGSGQALAIQSGTSLSIYTNNQLATAQMTLDASGNCGIGVTPSAWNSNYNALDIGQNGNISGRLGTSNTVDIVSNGYRNSAGNWVYKLATSNTACRYQLDGSTGSHIWYSGAAGTAGNTIAGFSTATMTLDASGNLLVGTTSSPSGAKVGAITKFSGVSAEGTASINVSTTPVALSRVTGTSGLFFVMGYNASGGAQGWYLVASTGSGTPTVISSGGTPGLTLTFTMAGGQLNAQTASGTFVANAFSITA